MLIELEHLFDKQIFIIYISSSETIDTGCIQVFCSYLFAC